MRTHSFFKSFFLLGFGSAISIASISACSGSTSSTSDGPVTTQTLDAIAGVLCDKISECTGDFAIKGSYGSLTTCKSRHGSQLQLDAKSPGYGVTEAGANACKSALASSACDVVLTGTLPAVCDFKGTIADAANCVSDAQCTSGTCFIATGGSCGKCGVRALEGADCSAAKCTEGLTCNTAKRCVKPGTEGVACSTDAPCAYPTRCAKGTCVKGLASGAACTLGKDADVIPCDPYKGLVCIPTKLPSLEGTCGAISIANAGEACGLVSKDPVKIAACSNSDCVKDKCEAYLADGATCTTEGTACQQPAKCRNGKCALLDAATCK